MKKFGQLRKSEWGLTCGRIMRGCVMRAWVRVRVWAWVWVGALGRVWELGACGVSGMRLKRTERALPSVEGSGEGGDSGKGRREASWGF